MCIDLHSSMDTPTKRQVIERPVTKRLVTGRPVTGSSHRTSRYQMSSLPNVQITKHPDYRTSRLSNVYKDI
jgi:hypothetical protein